VVVGSSAGGIEALSVLVSSLPVDFPAPLVLAQHLAPNFPSNLGAILERHTELQVIVVEETSALKPGAVYVVPANKHVVISDGHVALQGDHKERPRPSVDLLLSTAAASYGERLIAVILTGSGSDGAAGAAAVKQAGGTVIIQNPQTARYPSMPLALPPSIVDFERDIEDIGALLHALLTGIVSIQPSDEPADSLQEILTYIKVQTQVDFRSYKLGSLLRRLQRRMTTLHIATLDAYYDYLRASPAEVTRLLNTLLINVTEFFRDPEAYAFLKTDILPRLIAKAREQDRVLRFWAAGCATGEEAYSLAMLLADLLGSELDAWAIKIFATDLDEEAIAFARRGYYATSLLENVPDAYRTRFFARTDVGYRITAPLRQMVTFGEHDLSRNGPFPRIDLVVCRNVLIYFNVELQNLVLNNFAFALQPDGYLFLGRSEGVHSSQANYTVINKKWKIYQWTGTEIPRPISHDISKALPAPGRLGLVVRPITNPGSPDATGAIPNELVQLRHANQLLLRFLPMGIIVIDRHYRLLTANAAVRHLLGITEMGEVVDFLHAVRGIPYDVVRSAIDTVFRDKTTVSLPEVELDAQMGGTGDFVSMIITAMEPQSSLPELVAISVLNITESALTRRRLETTQAEQARLLTELHTVNRQLHERNRDLVDSNDALQAANEELVLTQEELQASIEEFETTNEELQAANEELETINEETQAINEELQTTNLELSARTLELQVTTTRLREEQEQLRLMSGMLFHAQEIERRRIAIELHDELGQQLTGLGFLLDNALGSVSSDGNQDLEQARALVRTLLGQVRQIALELRPSMLDDLGLVPTLLWHCENYTAQTQITVNFVHDPLEQRFTPDLETVAYRIIQEALTNVARYAEVPTVFLEIRSDAEALYLRIKDEGRGFDLRAVQSALPSTGISSMRERAQLLGGKFSLTTLPGHGTDITVQLPLHNA
jgi:two-component system, chemotaxis family, CheB/CheR fusion protein